MEDGRMKAIEWRKDSLQLLDQRELPGKTVWLTVRTADEMADLIKKMAVRGAPLIGICAAYALALEARINAGLNHLKEKAETLKKTRPTAVNLMRAIDRMLKAAERANDLSQALQTEAEKIHDEDRAACARIGKYGAELLNRGPVLTHCNTGGLATGGDGTAYAILKEGCRQGKITEVFACEARPFLQGARLTAFELKEDKIPFRLITDSMAGHFLSTGGMQAVIVGADRIAANGDVANKIGTYALAVLAKENNIPFYAAAPASTFDPSLSTGGEIPIEERNEKEVLFLGGVRIAPEGVKASNPAFDVTPARYIKGIITENGILKGGQPLAATPSHC